MGDLSKDVNSKFANAKVKALVNVLYTANWISSFQNAFFKPFRDFASAVQYSSES